MNEKYYQDNEDIAVAEAMAKRYLDQAYAIGPVAVFWAYLQEVKDMIKEGDTEASLDNIAGRMLFRASCEWDV